MVMMSPSSAPWSQTVMVTSRRSTVTSVRFWGVVPVVVVVGLTVVGFAVVAVVVPPGRTVVGVDLPPGDTVVGVIVPPGGTVVGVVVPPGGTVVGVVVVDELRYPGDCAWPAGCSLTFCSFESSGFHCPFWKSVTILLTFSRSAGFMVEALPGSVLGSYPPEESVAVPSMRMIPSARRVAPDGCFRVPGQAPQYPAWLSLPRGCA